MITAKEAREMSLAAQTKLTMPEIEAKIHEAANNRDCYVYIWQVLKPESIQELTSKGFEILVDDNSTKISW